MESGPSIFRQWCYVQLWIWNGTINTSPALIWFTSELGKQRFWIICAFHLSTWLDLSWCRGGRHAGVKVKNYETVFTTRCKTLATPKGLLKIKKETCLKACLVLEQHHIDRWDQNCVKRSIKTEYYWSWFHSEKDVEKLCYLTYYLFIYV